jgi:S1-C subfamily serine protease
MLKKLTAATAVVLALGFAAQAYAGGAYCSGKSASTAAWCGACLQRSASGAVTVAAIAKGSPAERAGLKTGDIVTAVNGYRLADSRESSMCSAKGECSVGSTVTYTVLRGRSSQSLKVKLEKMPADAANRFANRDASYDATLAALVLPAAK